MNNQFVTKIGPARRFQQKVNIQSNGCWQYLGSLNHQGYGLFHYNRKYWLSHRLFYTWIKGDIPEGLQLDHLCYNRSCVNPEHLEPVTAIVNQQRAMKNKCRHGHTYTPDNTRIDTKGHRSCRECERVSHRKYRKQCLLRDLNHA